MDFPPRTPDRILFASTDPQKLRIPSLAGDPAEMGGIGGCRIPALLCAALPGGGSALIAAADVGNEGADWGSLSLGIRRSLDGGRTWSPVRKAVSLQAHRAPQSFEDWRAAFTIDPLLLQAADGRLLLLADMWPESKGYGAPGWLDPLTGYETVDGRRYLALYAGPSGVGGGRADPGSAYTVRERGWVYDPEGRRTRYYLPQHHEARYAYTTLGDLYWAAGEGEYLDAPPPLIPTPPEPGRDVYAGNVFLSEGKPPLGPEPPAFVQKRLAGPEDGAAAPSSYRVLETDPAPLRCAVTMFLWLSESLDGGETWSQPRDISIHFKRESDGPFLGLGPGVGLRLTRQPDPARQGRLLIPLYNAAGGDLTASAAYSDDNGCSWRRAGGDGRILNRDEVQLAELRDGAVLALGRRGGGWHDGPGPTPVSVSLDGGETWRAQEETPLRSVRCQKSLIAYPLDDGSHPGSPLAYPPGMTPGRQYLLASCPTGQSGFSDCPRTDGAVFLGEVQENHTIRWIRSRPVAVPGGPYEAAAEPQGRRFFAYSCLSVLPDGRVGLLYEPQPNNVIAFFTFSLPWLLEGETPPAGPDGA